MYSDSEETRQRSVLSPAVVNSILYQLLLLYFTINLCPLWYFFMIFILDQISMKMLGFFVKDHRPIKLL
jgi:hypothetical protein